MARTPVIRLKNVIKKFIITGEEVTILKDISMEIYAGEYIILFGASGSGKSTIMNTIAGLEPPTSGEVVIRGENISKFSANQLAKFRRSKIGIVFQSFNLIGSFKVWENVAFPLTASGVGRQQRRDRAMALLRLLGLDKYAQRRPTELSGGQQQRVAIARALSINPWIIIADEPTGNLDSKAADDVMTIFRLLNRRSHRTIILVTHNPDYLGEADRVFYIKDGVIVRERKNSAPPDFDGDVKGLDDLKSLVFKEGEAPEKKPAHKGAKAGKEEKAEEKPAKHPKAEHSAAKEPAHAKAKHPAKKEAKEEK
jgi:putative ABC transport system ATP-binding protein